MAKKKPTIDEYVNGTAAIGPLGIIELLMLIASVIKELAALFKKDNKTAADKARIESLSGLLGKLNGRRRVMEKKSV